MAIRAIRLFGDPVLRTSVIGRRGGEREMSHLGVSMWS
jgi:hypothetical protein